ncbi:HEAT repeat domain-containing protein [Pedobacter sp. P26]|uniref:HEAT repeat domain-containing protein n=1 Tax=Pedobacter sp. P26 TaxID=3423956 RepID=UPI003D674AFD
MPEAIKERPEYTGKGDEYAALKDSSSASLRLLAILKIEKSNRINNHMLDMLSKTLNHDGNTNVRLAALNVLQKYSTDKYASSLLISSLNKQDDPMVQLGLVSFLGKMKNAEIGEKLYALANNPETFAAVRDEAYSALLNQDKL